MSFGTRLHEFMEAAMESAEVRLRKSIDHIFNTVGEKFTESNEQVRGLLGTSHSVDEMALYFPDRELLFIFMSKAVQRGWKLFNFSEDHVRTNPIPSEYTVEYWFMEHPEKPYRLELMLLNGGFSPYHSCIHESMQQSSSPAALVHASFKVKDESTYAKAVVALRAGGLELAQHCTSTYGRFSYFITDDFGKVALKPRINLRDGVDSGN